MSQVRRQMYASSFGTGTTITLSPDPNYVNMPGDLPMNQITINISGTNQNSCARHWGVSGSCQRFVVIIEKVT